MKLYLRGYEYKRDHRDDVEWVLRTFSRLPWLCEICFGHLALLKLSFLEHFIIIFVNVFDIQLSFHIVMGYSNTIH